MTQAEPLEPTITPDPEQTVQPPSVVDLGLSEFALVGRAQEGDLASFEVLVRRYQRPIFRLALRMLGDRGDADDAVQDTFVLMWRRLPTLVDASQFHGWIYQIATHRCLNLLRTRTRHPSVTTEAAGIEIVSDRTTTAGTGASTNADPARTAEHTARALGLEKALLGLSSEQRVCWVLREVDELSYTEIAQSTRLPVATVRGRIARARQNLAKGMDSWR